jgi:hypothetical protein
MHKVMEAFKGLRRSCMAKYDIRPYCDMLYSDTDITC